MPGVGDGEERAAVAGDLPGIGEQAGVLAGRHRVHGGVAELGGGIFEQLLDEGCDLARVALARRHSHGVPLRIDEHERRPCPHAVLLPRLHLRVVEHWVMDAMTAHRAPHGRVVGLVGELRRVHTDHHQAVAETLFQRTQLLDDVQAVDAAERPEVEQDHPAAQPGDGQRPVGVEPAGAAQLGSAHAGCRRGPGHARIVAPQTGAPASRQLRLARAS